MRYYVLYNPRSDNGNGRTRAERLNEKFAEDELLFFDITEIKSYGEFFKGIPAEDGIVLCGGDGTLNRFINDTQDIEIANPLYYHACGSGNDFRHDLPNKSDALIELAPYLKDLPRATVKGKEYLFINGVGYGIDGYCCEEGDRIRKEKPGKKINYTMIAITGLLFKYKPTNATVIVDGVEHKYEKVWLAPTMHGRFYGGGMNATPAQDRSDPERKLSVMLFHGSGKLQTLSIFPSIFKGEHVKHDKYVTVLTGHTITVKFDEPRALQVDGETILGVTEYTATSALAPKDAE